MDSTGTAVTPVGLVLAAGAGRRMGAPKALLSDPRGRAFLDLAVRSLREGGCGEVTVVLGSRADEAREVLERTGWHADPAVRDVVAEDWDEGMGASLRRGLDALAQDSPDPDAPGSSGSEAADGPACCVVTLVDLPDVGAAVTRRLVRAAGDAARDRTGDGGGDPVPDAVSTLLVRAAYDGVPGHPVLLGRAHWAGVRAGARGDSGARDYLARHPPLLVECADLATGADMDRPGPAVG